MPLPAAIAPTTALTNAPTHRLLLPLDTFFDGHYEPLQLPDCSAMAVES